MEPKRGILIQCDEVNEVMAVYRFSYRGVLAFEYDMPVVEEGLTQPHESRERKRWCCELCHSVKSEQLAVELLGKSPIL